ncbi:MAG: tetratricopeptide repeat protein [Acidobacteriota bacterium]
MAAVLLLAPAARAAEDTARFYGTWQAHILVNGQLYTVISIHDENGYRNFVRSPSGDTPAGEGTFSAKNGIYHTSAPAPNAGGVYYFKDSNTAVCTNSAGQIVTWRRIKDAEGAPITNSGTGPATAPPGGGPAPGTKHIDANIAAHNATGYTPSGRPGTEEWSAGAPAEQGQAGKYVPDPSLSADVNAALAAMSRKDYVTAWQQYSIAAQKGEPDGEFGLGAMLYEHLNPPGTGDYAQCERWLQAAASHGNAMAMEFLGRYYYQRGVTIAGGIDPGVNTTPIPPQERARAEERFRQSRTWLERASEKGDEYAMGNLALMLDAGVGGPVDRARAAQLREQVKQGPDKRFAQKITADPDALAFTAAWQAGHYADALQSAEERARQGSASAEALLGKAYYEGVGEQRNYATALMWLNKAAAQGNADAMFFLGLMYEHGRGVTQDLTRALDLFDQAADKGQGYAAVEARAIRMQKEIDRTVRSMPGGVMDTACQTAGGIPAGPECLKGGSSIDPFNAEEAASPQ